MNLSKDIQRIVENPNINNDNKKIAISLLQKSSQIGFGKIDSYREGYKLNGIGYARCTSILGMDGTKAAALMEWAKREVVSFAKEHLKYELSNDNLTGDIIDLILDNALAYPDKQKIDAAIEGTKHHDNVEYWLNGEPFDDNSILKEFVQIWKEEGVELVATEIPLVWHNKGLGFGGKCDILAYKDGKFVLYDIKTSRSVHESYALQISAYKEALEQMEEGLKISECKIIHLANLNNMSDWQKKQYNKFGNLIKCKNLTKAWKHYKILLEMYEMRNNKYF